MKKLCINQPAGIGDILYIQKIRKALQMFFEVYHPVNEALLWLKDYLDLIHSHEECKEIEFDEVLTFDHITPAVSSPDNPIMLAKYNKVEIPSEDYIEYIDIKRNTKKEKALFNKKVGSNKYRLICPWFGTPDPDGTGMFKKHIPLSDKLDNVIMNIEEGYTLFDWIKIIEEAEEIHTTDGAMMFLIEKYPCKATSLVAYSRRPHTYEIDYLFKKDWHYIT